MAGGPRVTSGVRPASRCLRVDAPEPWRRATIPAAVTVALGVSGHVAAGGHVPWLGAVLSLLPLLLIWRALAGQEIRFADYLALLAAGQVLVHVVAASSTHGAQGHPAPMLVSHAGATTLAALVLRRREATSWFRARFAALTAVISALAALASVPAPATGPLPRVVDVDLWATAAARGAPPRRRGPPADRPV